MLVVTRSWKRWLSQCTPISTRKWNPSLRMVQEKRLLPIRQFSSTTETTTSVQDDDSRPSSFVQLLNSEEQRILHEQKTLSSRARRVVKAVGGGVELKDDGSVLSSIIPDATFSVVIAGEFNAGKSTILNALLGRKVLETGSLPTTDAVTILVNSVDDDNADPNASSNHNINIELHRLPQVPNGLALIDTPGTNAVLLDHTARTLRLLPAADLILFCTSADRPFPDSERQLLKSIQAYRKNIIVVLNKIDVLDGSGGDHGKEEKQRVVDFVTENASELLGARPVVIPLSARDGLSSKLHSNERVWERSNLGALEEFLQNNLTKETKIKSKLSNPLGVAEGMVSECLTVLNDQQKELKTDVATLNLLHEQFGGWMKEMELELDRFRESIRTELDREAHRGHQFLEQNGIFETFQWGLLDMKHRMQMAWTASSPKSNQDMEQNLVLLVNELADTVATRSRAQGQAAIEYLGRRPAVKSQSLVGSVSSVSRFEDTRSALNEQLTKVVQTISQSSGNDHAANDFMKQIQMSAVACGVCQAGAAGTALVSALSPSVTFGLIPGVTGSIMLSALGSWLFSRGTFSAADRYQTTWTILARNMDESLASLSEKQLGQVKSRIMDGVAPYTRWVEAEQSRVQHLQEESESILVLAQVLRNRIKKLQRFG